MRAFDAAADTALEICRTFAHLPPPHFISTSSASAFSIT